MARAGAWRTRQRFSPSLVGKEISGLSDFLREYEKATMRGMDLCFSAVLYNVDDNTIGTMILHA
jgi:hypothetical protein